MAEVLRRGPQDHRRKRSLALCEPAKFCVQAWNDQVVTASARLDAPFGSLWQLQLVGRDSVVVEGTGREAVTMDGAVRMAKVRGIVRLTNGGVLQSTLKKTWDLQHFAWQLHGSAGSMRGPGATTVMGALVKDDATRDLRTRGK
jgi:hypothetical protein